MFRRLGAGRGFFFTLVGGVLGNLANAAFHANILGGHRSIGASTAVFAAVGVLAATQFIVDRSRGARRWTDWAMPIVGSLALLGMLGSSPHADLWAHFFGLLGGALAGLVAMRTSGDRMHHGFPARDRAVQVHYGAAAAALLVSAWIVALVVARAHGL